MRYAYLHGFASSSQSRKGVALRDAFARIGKQLALPDLNRPSFAALTYSGALAELDAMDAAGTGPWSLVGSSLGGYLAARWAELHPEKVARLVLLAPGFGLLERWPEQLGEEGFALWERKGAFAFPDANGEPTPVHWGLIEDARCHPSWPVTACPTLIVHGNQDEVVPLDFSRRYVAGHTDARLIEVDDGHDLGASVDLIVRESIRFFGL